MKPCYSRVPHKEFLLSPLPKQDEGRMSAGWGGSHSVARRCRSSHDSVGCISVRIDPSRASADTPSPSPTFSGSTSYSAALPWLLCTVVGTSKVPIVGLITPKPPRRSRPPPMAVEPTIGVAA